MTPARRRGALLVGLAAIVAALVGGRWSAMEVTERAWAASVAGGNVYLAMRDMGRLVHGVVLLVAVAWGIGNLYRVYRTIGSVQLPRRLGDLEIVEEVPHRVLLGSTLALGVLYGLLLGLGSGDWWLRWDLAAHPPRFGVSDPVLSHDLGYYVAELPWAVTCERFALVATLTALGITGLLYAGIGSLKLRGWRPTASAHARTHLGLLLGLLAAVCVWGANLDPARAVAGIRTWADPAALGVRIVDARLIAGWSVVAGLASLWWVLRERSEPMVAAWVILVIALGAGNVAALSVGRGPSAVDAERAQLEERAFGGDWREEPWPRGFPSAAKAIAAMPAWDASRIAAVAARAGRVAAALLPDNERATWLVVSTPESSRPGLDREEATASLVVTELDSSLAVRPAPARDSIFSFGPGFDDFALSPHVPALSPSTIALDQWWERGAFAWVLQRPEILHASDRRLVWRRDVSDRLGRLAPFADFATPIPVIVDSALLWVSYGYVTSEGFPLARALPWPGSDHLVRYVHLGLIGTVQAATGATTIYVAPGADSLATTWARLFAPLIHPASTLPERLETALPFPGTTFRMAAAALERAHADSGPWRILREPYELAAPLADDSTARLWTAVGFESGTPPALVALLAGTMTSSGPELYVWSPSAPVRGPAELLGSPETAPGLLRLWSADGGLFTEQALFDEPATGSIPKGLNQVYLTWGDREGQGPTADAALRALLAGGARPVPGDTSLAGRFELARRLAKEADSALATGDLVTFAHRYDELERVLGLRRPLAPPERAR